MILGLGNKILGDDGIGPRLTEDLQAQIGTGDISFTISALGGMELIDLMSGYSFVVIIDGIMTSEGKPGNVYFMNADDHLETLHLSSFHDMKFDTMLEYTRKIGVQMPGAIEIIAVEIKEDTLFSESFTPPIEKIYPSILQLITSHVQSLFARWQKIAVST